MKYEIKPKDNFSLGIKEIWMYRYLLYYFTWRDIKVKYKHATLGIAWAVIQPLLLMTLFSLLFQKGMKWSNSALPYPVFSFAGLTLWFYFSGSVSQAAYGLDSNSNIIRKIYFPRLIIPLSAIFVASFDFIFAFILLIGIAFLLGNGIFNTKLIIYIPLSLLITTLAAVGIGTIFSAMNILYKDFKYIIPFLIQFMFFASPVFYDISLLDGGRWSSMLEWNPLTGAIDLVRAAFSIHLLHWPAIYKGFTTSLLSCFFGIFIFRKIEHYLADII